MKHILFFLIIILSSSAICKAQVVYYEYDAAGNRVLRQAVPIRAAATNDSKNNTANLTTINAENTNTSLNTNAATIYPNPTAGELNVVLSEALTEGNISIYDIFGKVVYEQKLTSTKTLLNISKIASGTYSVKVQGKEYESTHKVVKY